MTVSPRPTGAPSDRDVRANIEDIVPLRTNQLALLLHRDLGSGDPGFLHVRYRLEGPVDVARYRRAWETVIGSHPSLRTSIRGRDGGDPLAIVWRRVEVPFDIEDWRSVPDRDECLAEVLEADRVRGLDVGEAPVMRIRLLRTGDATYEVVWTCHHLFVDGWSAAIVLEDVMAAYRVDDGTIPGSRLPNGALRQYSSWVAGRDPAEAEKFWATALRGYPGSSGLVFGTPESQRTEPGDLVVSLPAELTNRMAEAAALVGVTPATLAQAAWALTLAIAGGMDDLAFGTTVSGRNADVDGMDRLVGFFTNTVPVRVRLDRSQPVDEWLRTMRSQQFDMALHEEVSLADIHACSDVPGHRPLFDTFAIVENFPAADEVGADVVQRNFRSGLTTVYPITIAIGLTEPAFLRLRFERDRCSDDAAAAVIAQYERALEAIVAHPGGSVGEVLVHAGDRVSHLVSRREAAATASLSRPPSNDTEHRLEAVWRHHLGLSAIDVDADYFDLGGTSVGAVQMFASIRSEFDVDLPMSTLLLHPTIRGMASVLTGVGEGARVEWDCLVPIQPEGTRPPIAAVHGGGGDVLFYRNLARELGDDQPLYGLQPVGLDGVTEPLDRVPAMAERYISELLQVQPRGPYRLIGFCFGGTVCLEMAAQLEEQGHEVDYLGIIDGGLPIDAARYDGPGQRVRYLVASRGVTGLARAGWRRLTWRMSESWQNAASRRQGFERADFVPVATACRRAFVAFEPRPSSAPITLIRSTEVQAGEGTDWDFTWEDYTPSVDVATIDADHLTLFETPGAADLARIIEGSLPD